MQLLKIIGKPYDEFKLKFKKILNLVSVLEETKRFDFLEEMEDYIFQSRWEDRQMLEEEIMGRQKVMTLYERALEEGIEKGIEQGIEKGIEQGIEKGIEQGIEKGIEQGIERGRLEGEFRKALDTARILQDKKFSILEIQEITGLSVAVLVEHGIISAP